MKREEVKKEEVKKEEVKVNTTEKDTVEKKMTTVEKILTDNEIIFNHTKNNDGFIIKKDNKTFYYLYMKKKDIALASAHELKIRNLTTDYQIKEKSNNRKSIIAHIADKNIEKVIKALNK